MEIIIYKRRVIDKGRRITKRGRVADKG